MDRGSQLIRLLADGELHSGEMIAEQLGMTRAAVWKALRKVCERQGLDRRVLTRSGLSRWPHPSSSSMRSTSWRPCPRGSPGGCAS